MSLLPIRIAVAVIIASAIIPSQGDEPSGPVLTNCLRVAELSAHPTGSARFDFRATVTTADDIDDSTIKPRASIEDRTASIYCFLSPDGAHNLRPGDIARFQGTLVRNEFGEGIVTISNVTDVVHGPAPAPKDVSFDEVKSGRFDDRLVRVTGVLRSVTPDELDPRFYFLVLANGKQLLYVAVRANTGRPRLSPDFLGATVAVTGVCQRNRHSLTRPPYRRIERQIGARPESIEILRPAEADFNRIPDVSTIAYRLPQDLTLNQQFRACGHILAAWHGDTVLLRLTTGLIVRAVFRAHQPLPAVGEPAEVVGFPDFNLFTLSLTGCRWCHADLEPVPEQPSVAVAVRGLLEDSARRAVAKVQLHGTTIRVEGVVRYAVDSELNRRMLLESDGFLVPVDPGTCPDSFADVPAGSWIAATGVCVMNIDDWRPNAPFPRVRGVTVVLRTPADLAVIARPSWWTPFRLAVLLVSVLAVLCFSAALNIIFRRHIARRTLQLEREIGARVEADCKVRERTRLAVELHDAISQNLTGVAFQLQTVRNSGGDMSAVAAKHLAVAEQTLGSCRDELRNCLWDLRNSTLECADLNEAIRQTLAPHLGDADLSVRFDVARARFTDNFAHALLRIIRELATNAVRHGHATRVKVAGCIDDGRLRFSVSDNGCGFDPQGCPGFEEGHFGLLGVRERIDGFEGELSVDSGPGGTKVTASMALTTNTELRNGT